MIRLRALRRAAPWLGGTLLLAAALLYLSPPRGLAAENAAPSTANAKADSPFKDWAVVVAAGEWHAANGAPTQGFDNARRDVAAAFERAGFAPSNVAELSVRPDLYPKEPLFLSNIADLRQALQRTADQAPAGCLFYLTTHGSRAGTPVGDSLMMPHTAAALIQSACGDRPTVVILSACFSGIFIPALAAPNRMVLTAARPDRTSFGCGQSFINHRMDKALR